MLVAESKALTRLLQPDDYDKVADDQWAGVRIGAAGLQYLPKSELTLKVRPRSSVVTFGRGASLRFPQSARVL